MPTPAARALAVSDQRIAKKAIEAVEKLLRQDLDLLERDLNERTITHRLAIYLQEKFPDFDVDCEYNRDGIGEKDYLAHEGIDLDERVPIDDKEGRSAFPDILVHVRKTNAANLLVIEAKKTTKADDRLDHAKLRAFLDPQQRYRYRLALFVIIRTGEDGTGVKLVFRRFDAKTNRIADIGVMTLGARLRPRVAGALGRRGGRGARGVPPSEGPPASPLRA